MVKEHEKEKECSRNGGKEECLRGFVAKATGKETIKKTKT
jgi:hypothetical protein